MGEGIDTSDIYELKKENEKLKNQLDIMNTKGFDLIQMQMQNSNISKFQTDRWKCCLDILKQ